MNVKPPPPTLKEIPDAETVKANIITAMRTSILPVTAEWLEEHILKKYQYKLSEAAGLYGFASIEEMLFEIAGIEACPLPYDLTNFKLTSSGGDVQRSVPIVRQSPAIASSNVSSVQRSLPIVHHSPAIVTPKVQQQRVPPTEITARRFTGAAAILRNKSKAPSQNVSPVKMEENVPIEKYFIEQTIKSNGGAMYFDVLKYHYYMHTGRHLNLEKLNEIMRTQAGDLSTAQKEKKVKFTLHKNQFIVKFGPQHAPAHADEWNSLMEAVLDTPEKKFLINEDYLKEAGFELSQEEFINFISINEVLKEMFQFSLGDGSPVLSLVQT